MDTEGSEPDFPDLDRMLRDHYKNKRKELAEACPTVEDLFEYIDGGLDRERAAGILQHVPICDPCHDIILAFKLPLPEPADHPPAWPDFKERLPEDLRPIPKPKGPWDSWVARVRRLGDAGLQWWKPAGALASVLFMVSAWLLGLYPTALSRLAYISANAIPEVRSSFDINNDLPNAYYNAYYYKGLETLSQSQFWIFQRVDRAKVDEGIRHLEKAQKLAEEAGNQTHIVNCQFFLGKAYLKKGAVAEARKQFETIVPIYGSSTTVLKRQHEAREILKELEKLKSSPR